MDPAQTFLFCGRALLFGSGFWEKTFAVIVSDTQISFKRMLAIIQVLILGLGSLIVLQGFYADCTMVYKGSSVKASIIINVLAPYS